MENPSRVLLVEDDPAMRRWLGAVLEVIPGGVHAVGTGRAALEALEREDYALVCLDLSLPDLSGFELCQEICSRGARAAPPVIVISARNLPIDRSEAAEHGASAFLTKPLEPEALLTLVRDLLAQRKESAAVERLAHL